MSREQNPQSDFPATFYTDEPINPYDGDGSVKAGYGLPEGTDSVHSWDYFAPDEDDAAGTWQIGNVSPGVKDAPEKIRMLLGKIRRQPWQITMAKSFYEQALFMADYKDSAEIVPYMNYFPTYRDMTIDQMRSYFTLRRMWRQGKYPDASLSYIFVYVYELLMQVGIGTSEDGYEILRELLAAYSPAEPKLERYLRPWLRDYVVYYNLDGHFKEVFAEENRRDALAAVLDDYARTDGGALLDAVCSLSRYDIRKSLLFAKQPDKARGCAVAVLRAIAPLLEQVRHHRLVTLCLGKRVRRQVTMFSNAVFYNPRPVREAEIQVAPRHRYFCRGGLWSKDEFVADAQDMGRLLSTILREADCQMRVLFGVKPRLQPRPAAEPYRQLIHEAIAAWAEQEREAESAREAERRRVRIDFSKLGRIRQDAEVVKDLLGTEDAASDTDNVYTADSPETAPVSPAQAAQPLPRTPQPSVDEEQEKDGDEWSSFLRLFLSGGDWQGYLRKVHVPEGVMVEDINNRMMDEIGDIVLEDDGSGLRLIEDYRADIEQMLSNENDNT